MNQIKICVLDYADGNVKFFKGNPEWDEEEIVKYLTEEEGFSLGDIEWMVYRNIKGL